MCIYFVIGILVGTKNVTKPMQTVVAEAMIKTGKIWFPELSHKGILIKDIYFTKTNKISKFTFTTA